MVQVPWALTSATLVLDTSAYPGIDLVDFVVAIAARLDAPPWTRDVKRFPMLKGVRDPCGP